MDLLLAGDDIVVESIIESIHHLIFECIHLISLYQISQFFQLFLSDAIRDARFFAYRPTIKSLQRPSMHTLKLHDCRSFLARLLVDNLLEERRLALKQFLGYIERF